MADISWEAAGFLVALLGPAVFVSVKHALREVTTLDEKKVVVITGASSGLGKSCAKEFFKRGCHIVLCSRNVEKLHEIKKELLSLKNCMTKNEPVVVKLDLLERESVLSAAETINKIYPNGINILINNAGVSYRGEIASTSIEVYRSLMETNYFGSISFTKALIPSMLKIPSKEGKTRAHIVSVNSVQGKISIPHRSAYSASKYACVAFFDCLRSELAESGIRVCTVYPSYIKTNLSLNAIKGDGRAYGKLDLTTESGMSPSYVAEKIVEAVQWNKDEVYLMDAKSRLAVWLRFFLPSVYFWAMRKRAKSKVD